MFITYLKNFEFALRTYVHAFRKSKQFFLNTFTNFFIMSALYKRDTHIVLPRVQLL